MGVQIPPAPPLVSMYSGGIRFIWKGWYPPKFIKGFTRQWANYGPGFHWWDFGPFEIQIHGHWP